MTDDHDCEHYSHSEKVIMINEFHRCAGGQEDEKGRPIGSVFLASVRITKL